MRRDRDEEVQQTKVRLVAPVPTEVPQNSSAAAAASDWTLVGAEEPKTPSTSSAAAVVESKGKGSGSTKKKPPLERGKKQAPAMVAACTHEKAKPGGNQHAGWTKCVDCGERLSYWSKKDNTLQVREGQKTLPYNPAERGTKSKTTKVAAAPIVESCSAAAAVVTTPVNTSVLKPTSQSSRPSVAAALNDRVTVSAQLGAQVFGIVVAAAWSVVISVILFKVLGAIFGLRVAQEEEVDGLDLAEYGERGYDFN